MVVVVSTDPSAPPSGYSILLTGKEPKRRTLHKTAGAWVLCDDDSCNVVFWLIPSYWKRSRHHYCQQACRVKNMDGVFEASREAFRRSREIKAARDKSRRQFNAPASPSPPVPTRCVNCGGLIHDRGKDIYGIDWSCYNCGYGGPVRFPPSKANA
jgi:hypothetical protein